MNAKEDLAKVIEGSDRPRMAENDQVEPAVIVSGDGNEGQSKGISGEIEKEDSRPAKRLFAARVKDADGNHRESVGKAGAEDGPNVSHTACGSHSSRTRKSASMVPGDDIGIEPESGHEKESPPRDLGKIDRDRTAGRDQSGQAVWVASQSKMPGDKILSPGRHDGYRHAWMLVEEG